MKTTPLIRVALLAALSSLAACDRDTDRVGDGVGETTTPAPVDRPGDDTLGEKVDRAGAAMEEKGEKLGEAIDDAAVTARVKAALVADPGLSALKIDVDSRDGVVTLRGDADSAEASERAASLARDTEGVVSVDNQLVVTPGG